MWGGQDMEEKSGTNIRLRKFDSVCPSPAAPTAPCAKGEYRCKLWGPPHFQGLHKFCLLLSGQLKEKWLHDLTQNIHLSLHCAHDPGQHTEVHLLYGPTDKGGPHGIVNGDPHKIAG